MRFGYADPPYPGQSLKHYGDHPDYAGEVDHRALVDQLRGYDGWLLHTSANTLQYVLRLLGDAEQFTMEGNGWQVCHECGGVDTTARPTTRYTPGGIRIFSWVKPFAAFKRNVSPAYAWEPVIVKPLRKGEPNQRAGSDVMRDWLAESITLKRGLTGAKPERVCFWLFEACGLRPDDELVDLFPGSGAVTEVWNRWCAEPSLLIDGVVG